jgi:hypothetical protein
MAQFVSVHRVKEIFKINKCNVCGMLNSPCFSIICEAENMQSMKDLPFLKPFCSSNSKSSAITVNHFAMIFEYILYPVFNQLISL